MCCTASRPPHTHTYVPALSYLPTRTCNSWSEHIHMRTAQTMDSTQKWFEHKVWSFTWWELCIFTDMTEVDPIATYFCNIFLSMCSQTPLWPLTCPVWRTFASPELRRTHSCFLTLVLRSLSLTCWRLVLRRCLIASSPSVWWPAGRINTCITKRQMTHTQTSGMLNNKKGATFIC